MRYVVFEFVEDLKIFVGDFEDGSPDFFSGRRHDARQTAAPLRRPAAKLHAMVGEIGREEKLMLRGSALELRRVQIVRVKEELH